MTDLLSPILKQRIRDNFKSVADTFHHTPITINLRSSTTKKPFGEGYVVNYTHVNVLCRMETSKASGERYINVKDSPKGKDYQDGYKVFIWKDTLDTALAGRVVNPETDRVIVDGVEFEIRMFDVSNRFSSIGPLMYEMDVTKKEKGA